LEFAVAFLLLSVLRHLPFRKTSPRDSRCYLIAGRAVLRANQASRQPTERAKCCGLELLTQAMPRAPKRLRTNLDAARNGQKSPHRRRLQHTRRALRCRRTSQLRDTRVPDLAPARRQELGSPLQSRPRPSHVWRSDPRYNRTARRNPRKARFSDLAFRSGYAALQSKKANAGRRGIRRGP